ncbi:MAG TPA: proton-conducting transporter membrane subunit [Tepidisphaeraceae bacterium]
MRFLNDWLLTILLLVPAIGGAAVLWVRPVRAARRTAIGIALATFCLSLLILIPFRRQQGMAYDDAPLGTVQMVRSLEILPAMHAGYRVAMDGLSLPFVVLTTFLCAVLVVLPPVDERRPRVQLAMFLWLELATLGVFLAFDFLLLWAFLAFMVLPCSGLIWLSAGGGRARATMAFLVPMLVALACLLVAVMGERLMSTHCLTGGTLDLVRLAACPAGWGMQTLFALALISFLLRLPVVPFHSWLTAIAAETSPAVAGAIGALLPLTGGYGLFRVVLPLFPAAAASLWWVMAGLGLLTVFYHALAAIGQPGLRRAVVHLSITMSGFVLIGAATYTPAGANGAVFTLLAGSLISAFLLLLAGGTGAAGESELSPQSGTAWGASLMAGMLTLLAVSGFLGPVVVLFGAFQAAQRDSMLLRLRAASPGWLIALAGGIAIGSLLFGLAGVQVMRSITGTDRSSPPAQAVEERCFNVAVLAPLAVVTVLLGGFAAPWCFAFTRRAIGALMGMP